VAVVQFEQQQFLVGGTASSLVLLAKLSSVTGGEEHATSTDQQDQDKD
jgi:hypothetical protein